MTISTMTDRREHYVGRQAGGRRELHVVSGWLGNCHVVAAELVAPEDHAVVSRRAIRSDRLAPLRAALEHTEITAQPAVFGAALAHPGVAVRVSAWCTRHGRTISLRYVSTETGEPLGWPLDLRDPEAIEGLRRAVAALDAEPAAAPPVVAPRPSTTTDDGLLTRRPARNRGWCPRTSPHPFASLHSTSNPKRKAHQ